MLCLFLHFFISFKFDFHVDAERMITKQIFVGYGQLNSITVLDFLHQHV